MWIKKLHQLTLILLIIVLSSSSYGTETAAQGNTCVGEFNIDLKVRNIDQSSNTALADIDVIVSLPTGNRNTTLIPIPAPKNPNIEYYIEPESSQNNILFGHIRPDENYAVFQIFLLETPSKLHFKLKNIVYPLKSSDKSESGKALYLSVDRSYEELKKSFVDFKFAQLNKVTINKSFFQGSTPQATLSSNSKYYEIDIQPHTASSPIVIYLKVEEKQYFLYMLLGVMGLLLGLLSAPKVITSKKSSIIWIVISSFALAATIIICVSYLSIEQILTDTTTIVTIGTIAGVFVGILGTAIVKIVNAD
jgi:hypothetical protein